MAHPAHPDYARILQLIAEHDDAATQQTVRQLHEGKVDPDSLRVAAHGRARATSATVPLPLFLATWEPSLAAVWADGFLTGIDFDRAQQSTPTPEEN